jgi:protein-L-isoaspartate(D-aspartate) O-methyltransferase
VPPALYEQLAPGGRIVVPVGGSGGQRLVRIERGEAGPVETGSLACRFVPLV